MVETTNKQHLQRSMLYPLLIGVDLDYHGDGFRTVYISKISKFFNPILGLSMNSYCLNWFFFLYNNLFMFVLEILWEDAEEEERAKQKKLTEECQHISELQLQKNLFKIWFHHDAHRKLFATNGRAFSSLEKSRESKKVVLSLCHKTNEAKLFFNFSNNCFTTFKLIIVGGGETGSMYVQRYNSMNVVCAGTLG